ncbi:hypothetical protein KJ972_06175 [Candidatus Micrarchaeota archaeon]|nr:hypothetical protein [Candidatus Micrarchaeota archaeon]
MKTILIFSILLASLFLVGCLDFGTQIPPVAPPDNNANQIPPSDQNQGLLPPFMPSDLNGEDANQGADLNMDQNAGLPLGDETGKITYCETLVGYQQETCYLEYSLLLEDLELCEENSGVYNGLCAGYLQENCFLVEGTPLQNYCFFKRGIRNESASLCALIIEPDYASSCIAAVDNEPASCTSLYHDACFFELAIKDQNESNCSETATNPSNEFLPALCLTLLNDGNLFLDQNVQDATILDDENAVEEPVEFIIPSDSHGKYNPGLNRRDFNLLVDQAGFTPNKLYVIEDELLSLRIQSTDLQHNFYRKYQDVGAIVTVDRIIDRIIEPNEIIAVFFTVPALSVIDFSCTLNCDASAVGTIHISPLG